MKFKIAVIDDNIIFAKIIKSFILTQIAENPKTPGLQIEVNTFNSIEKFEENNDKNFNIVILDCIFEGNKLDGIQYSKEVKKHNFNSKVILITEFASKEFMSKVLDKKRSIDFYADKKLDDNTIINKIEEYLLFFYKNKEAQLKKLAIKLYVYKSGNEYVPLKHINFAKVKDRRRHLITVSTSQGEKTLTTSLNNFVDRINKSLNNEELKASEEKIDTTLYLNKSNVKKIDSNNLKIYFKKGSPLIINNNKQFKLIEEKMTN
jgi:DNA-binding NarL/FixJ family response regulator